jgi:SAM-dependent methyltransferase
MTMQKEKMFSREGFYSFIVHSNAITHHEAMAIGKTEVAQWLSERTTTSPVKALDLACGGEPITICDIMAAFPNVLFEYVGIDINPDQVKLAKHFSYPKNVRSVTAIEGSAWDLKDIASYGPYDFVFSGLNFHHGVPEELLFVSRQIRNLVGDQGLLISHDLYRPDRYTYLRRPERSAATGEDLHLVVTDKLLRDEAEKFVKFSPPSPRDWRQDFIDLESQHLKSLGADEETISGNAQHMWHRDYPVSATEMSRILQHAGWKATIHDLEESNHPLKEYFCIISARPA